jgi:hypothetical protein
VVDAIVDVVVVVAGVIVTVDVAAVPVSVATRNQRRDLASHQQYQLV